MPLDEKIIAAAKAGDISTVEYYLQSDRSRINATDQTGNALLHIAIIANQVKLVEFLLKNGADVNQPGHSGLKAMHMVAGINNTQIMNLLFMTNKLSILERDPDGNTPLHYAIHYGKYDTAKFLIEHGARVNERNNLNQSPLHLLCLNKTFSRDTLTSLANLLIEEGKTNLDLTIPMVIDGDEDYSYPLYNLSEYAQYHHAPAIADLIDEKKWQNAQKQLVLQDKVSELEKKVRLLEKRVRKMKAKEKEKAPEAGEVNKSRLFTVKN